MINRRQLLAAWAFASFAGLGRAGTAAAGLPVAPWAARLVAAARAQIGVTTLYDPAYVKLDFPGGDVPADRAVCTDVIIRAYRDGLSIDLQREIHDDMATAFKAYPKIWGLKSTDRNIDHRRVANQATFFTRHGEKHAIPDDPLDFAPGDLVTQTVGVNLPHIVIVSDRLSEDGSRPLVIHNIGRGAQEEDSLTAWPITGHYRFSGQV